MHADIASVMEGTTCISGPPPPSGVYCGKPHRLKVVDLGLVEFTKSPTSYHVYCSICVSAQLVLYQYC